MILDRDGKSFYLGICCEDERSLLSNGVLLDRPECLDGRLFSVSMFNSSRSWLDYSIYDENHFLRINRDSWWEHRYTDLDSLSVVGTNGDFNLFRVFYCVGNDSRDYKFVS